jgi:hypothetical protein
VEAYIALEEWRGGGLWYFNPGYELRGCLLQDRNSQDLVEQGLVDRCPDLFVEFCFELGGVRGDVAYVLYYT